MSVIVFQVLLLLPHQLLEHVVVGCLLSALLEQGLELLYLLLLSLQLQLLGLELLLLGRDRVQLLLKQLLRLLLQLLAFQLSVDQLARLLELPDQVMLMVIDAVLQALQLLLVSPGLRSLLGLDFALIQVGLLLERLERIEVPVVVQVLLHDLVHLEALDLLRDNASDSDSLFVLDCLAEVEFERLLPEIGCDALARRMQPDRRVSYFDPDLADSERSTCARHEKREFPHKAKISPAAAEDISVRFARSEAVVQVNDIATTTTTTTKENEGMRSHLCRSRCA